MVLPSDLLIRPRASGIVIPPQDIKKMADKTAQYVAKNGSNFEDLVLQKELNKPEFCFLQRGNIYRAYYEHKVAEYARGLVEVNVAETAPQQSEPQPQIQQPQLPIQRDPKRKAPQADQYTVEPPRNLSMLDLDVIKHTASFVAMNGKKFLVSLTEKEKHNPQFEFLKPTHDLFQFFLKLVDAYKLCLQPKKDDIERYQIYQQDKSYIYQRCLEKFEYENIVQKEKQNQQQLDDQEKKQMAMIDWNDFAVVETIDFFDDETAEAIIEKQTQRFDRFNFAALDTQLNLKNQQIIQQQLPGQIQEITRPKEAITLHSTKPKDVQYETPAPPTHAEESVRIVTDYVRPTAQQETTMVKCEICNRNFPKNQINEHIQIELQDPRYVEIRNEVTEKGKVTTMPNGIMIAKHLQQLKRKRPDIFNPADEEELIQQKEPQKKVQTSSQPPPPPPKNLSTILPPPPPRREPAPPAPPPPQ